MAIPLNPDLPISYQVPGVYVYQSRAGAARARRTGGSCSSGTNQFWLAPRGLLSGSRLRTICSKRPGRVRTPQDVLAFTGAGRSRGGPLRAAPLECAQRNRPDPPPDDPPEPLRGRPGTGNTGAVAAGILTVWICGQRFDLQVANGDTYAAIAAKPATQIQAGQDVLPCTATVVGATVTLTARHASQLERGPARDGEGLQPFDGNRGLPGTVQVVGAARSRVRQGRSRDPDGPGCRREPRHGERHRGCSGCRDQLGKCVPGRGGPDGPERHRDSVLPAGAGLQLQLGCRLYRNHTTLTLSVGRGRSRDSPSSSSPESVPGPDEPRSPRGVQADRDSLHWGWGSHHRGRVHPVRIAVGLLRPGTLSSHVEQQANGLICKGQELVLAGHAGACGDRVDPDRNGSQPDPSPRYFSGGSPANPQQAYELPRGWLPSSWTGSTTPTSTTRGRRSRRTPESPSCLPHDAVRPSNPDVNAAMSRTS